jgi:hypothetical protein
MDVHQLHEIAKQEGIRLHRPQETGPDLPDSAAASPEG